MDFDLTDDQREIRDAARELLAARAPRHEAGAEVWRELVELGWPALGLPEEHGGAGGLVEVALLLGEHAYALVSSPFLGTALAGQLVARAGSDAQRARWLPALASGATTGCAGAGIVADAPGAGLAVLAAAEGLLLVPDPDVEPVETVDGLRRYGRVAGAGEVLPGAGAPACAAAEVLVAAELVGVAARALDESVAYAKERTQFDRPIGSFQAVAHRCADMLVAVEGARAAVLAAAWACDADPARAPRAAAVAKAAASDAAREVTASAIQVHGGVGFTWESPVHWLYKRAQLSAALWGGATAQRIRLVREHA